MKFKLEFRFGLVIAFLLLFWYTVEYVLGVHTEHQQYHVISSLLYNLPMGGLIIYSMWVKKKVYSKNEITFMDGLRHGLSVTFWAGSLSMLSIFMFMEFINPEFFPSMIEFQAEKYIQSNMSPEDARLFAESSFNIRAYIFNTFLATMGFGSIFSLLGGYLLKNIEVQPKAN